MNTAPLTDLGTAALERASELTSSAAELVPEIPEKVGRLARRARQRVRPTKTTSRWRPALLIVAVVGACVALVVWMRRSGPEPNAGVVPPSETERAIAAVG